MSVPVFKLECECGWTTSIDVVLYEAKQQADKHIVDSPDGNHYVYLITRPSNILIAFVERPPLTEERIDAITKRKIKESAIGKHKSAST